jgi:hypothetical protein
VNHPNELADRYVAIWNEADDARRRQAVAELWTEDAVHLLHQQKDPAATSQTRGHGDLEARVARTYEEYIASGAFSFRSRNDAAHLGDAVRFTWEMVSADGEVIGVAQEFVVLDADGRIRTDYEFMEA